MKRILHQLRFVVYPIIYKGVQYIPGGCLEFLPSTGNDSLVFPDRSPRWLYFSVSRLPTGGIDHLLHSSVVPASSTGRTNWIGVSFTKCHVPKKIPLQNSRGNQQQKTQKPTTFSFSSMICMTKTTFFPYKQKHERLENRPSVPCSSDKRRRRFSPRTSLTWSILPSAWAMKWYCWWAGNPGI